MKLLDAPGGMTFYVAWLNRDVKVRVTLVLVRGISQSAGSSVDWSESMAITELHLE